MIQKVIKLLPLFLIMTILSYAQDKVYVKGESKPRDVKVVEIGINEVKVQDNSNDVIEAIEKMDIVKIVYANGRTQTFNDTETSMNMYKDMNKNVFKIGLFGYSVNSIPLYYERALKPGVSYEAELRIIGVGNKRIIYSTYDYNTNKEVNIYDNPHGVRLGLGYKAVKLPDFVNGRVRYRHILQGSYLKPYGSIDFYNTNLLKVTQDPTTQITNVTGVKKSIYSFSLGFEAGRQYIIGNRFSIDFFIGVGYNISNFSNQYKKLDNDANLLGYLNTPIQYGYIRLSNQHPAGIMFSAGVKMGYVFNWAKDKNGDTKKVKSKS